MDKKKFHNTLKFLTQARKAGKQTGYNPIKLNLADDGIHKLQYETPEGKIIKFGRLGYGDFIYYKEFDKNIADEKRRLYRARATKIKGDWKKNKYSKNNLAINILW